MTEPTFYTVEEVAKIMRTSEQAVRDWIRDCKLIATKPGKIYLIRPRDLQRMVDEYLTNKSA